MRVRGVKGSREGPDDKVETFNASNVETFRIQAQFFRFFFLNKCLDISFFPGTLGEGGGLKSKYIKFFCTGIF